MEISQIIKILLILIVIPILFITLQMTKSVFTLIEVDYDDSSYFVWGGKLFKLEVDNNVVQAV